MKQIEVNPSNKPYYSEDFIKGFECGTKTQFDADKKEEIVTCKDCKYYREDDDAGYCTNHTCGDIVFWCHDDYYCADAERRE